MIVNESESKCHNDDKQPFEMLPEVKTSPSECTCLLDCSWTGGIDEQPWGNPIVLQEPVDSMYKGQNCSCREGKRTPISSPSRIAPDRHQKLGPAYHIPCQEWVTLQHHEWGCAQNSHDITGSCCAHVCIQLHTQALQHHIFLCLHCVVMVTGFRNTVKLQVQGVNPEQQQAARQRCWGNVQPGVPAICLIW